MSMRDTCSNIFAWYLKPLSWFGYLQQINSGKHFLGILGTDTDFHLLCLEVIAVKSVSLSFNARL